MPLLSFSDLAFLWPFANEAAKTLFVYKAHRVYPPENEKAMLALTGAMGRIVMDDASPGVYDVDDAERGGPGHAPVEGRHVIYVGGPARNGPAADFLKACEQRLGTTARFLIDDRPRAFHVGDPQAEPRLRFTAEYHDDEKVRVRADYGLVVLTFNPFDGRDQDPDDENELHRGPNRALLVAGLHSQGTLAAAETISRPDLARQIVGRLVANCHLPPHVLGTVEVIVRAGVDEGGDLKKEAGRDEIQLEYIAVNGLELFPRPNRHAPRKAYPALPFGKGRIVRIDRRPIDDEIQLTEDVEVTFVEEKPLDDDQKKDSAFAVKGQPCDGLTDAFFEYFAGRHLVIISPHSDDSVIGCGGLVYYVRNRELWERKGRKEQRPDVHVLVMTASPGGVLKEQLEDYCSAIGVAKAPDAVVDAELHAELRAQMRRNESRSEAFLLGTSTCWMHLTRPDDPRAYHKLEETLEGIRRRSREVRPLTVLIPPPEDQHATHRLIREVVLRFLRNRREYDDTDVWAYESPWGALAPTDINVVLPLDKHAMFAKCQAIAMHHSQETRTRFSEVARTRARLKAEVLPEELFAFGGGRFEWHFVEVFQRVRWKMGVFASICG